MTISKVVGQNTGGSTAGATSATQAFPGNVTSGNLVVCVVWTWNSSTSHVFVSGDLTKSAGTATISAIQLDKQLVSGIAFLEVGIFSAIVTGSGSLTFQISNLPAGTDIQMGVDEFASTVGWDSARTVSTNANYNASSTPADSGTATCTSNGLFVGVMNLDSGATITTIHGFTDSFLLQSTPQQPGVMSYLISSPTTISAAWTLSPAAAWLAAVSVYQEVSGINNQLYYISA